MNSTIKKVTKYIESEYDLELTFEPVPDTLSIEKTDKGYTARYLVQDNNSQSPDKNEDTEIFLVHYHRQFYIERKDVINENDLKSIFLNEVDEDSRAKEIGNKYHILPVFAYIHSGLSLSLGNTNYPFTDEWDTSCCGAILVSKEEWKELDKANAIAQSLIEEWNQYLSGDVYGIVKEEYDTNKKQINKDSCWGFYGQEYALEELKGR